MLSQHTRLSIKKVRSSSTGHISMQTRHFWPFNKRSLDWSSHLDPTFHRYHRQRNIATRAKLLKSIRRLKQWEFGEHAHFFTPRHARLASHYNGRYKPRWIRETGEEDGKVERTEELGNDTSEDSGTANSHELSEREKLWQEQMRRLRHRIEQDPYEAVFGRRFEPFWTNLVPRWMGEDSTEPKPDRSRAKQDVDINSEAHNKSSVSDKPSNYSYSSSTSWNSWTNKAVKTEWDSVSGETKHYEYDPISNRMVQVPGGNEPTSLPQDGQVKANAQSKEVKPIPSERKAIPVPFVQVESKAATNPNASQADTRAAVERTQSDNAIESLTADSIRASMGKPNTTQTTHRPVTLTQDQQQIQALLDESKPKISASSRWDHAEQYYMLEQELQNLQAKRDNLVNEERRAFHFGNLARRHEKLEGDIKIAMERLEKLNNEHIQMAATAMPASSHASSLPKQSQDGVPTSRSYVADAAKQPLRSAIDRMQSKPALTTLELDDSAAHESTEAASNIPKSWNKQVDLLQADRVKRTSSNLRFPEYPPKWVNELADRQEAQANDKTATERALKLSKTNQMLQAEIDRQKLAMTLQEEQRSRDVRALRSEGTKINENETVSDKELQLLRAKISDLESAEGKYKNKIAALKQELDTAYQQSSRHADEFRDQLKKAEQRGNYSAALAAKYKSKLAAMKENLDQAYAQSSRNADEYMEQLKKAEAASQRLASQVSAKSMRSQLLDERFAKYKAADTSQKAKADVKADSSTPLELASSSAPPFKEVKHAYRFAPDDLEAELVNQGKHTGNVYRFKEKKTGEERNNVMQHQTRPRAARPPQGLRAQLNELSSMVDEVKHGRPSTNPIDGTTSPVTGNYASPTGFVRYDQISREKTRSSSRAEDRDSDHINNARIKREERVFTGTKRVQSAREANREFRHSYRRRRARRNRIIKFIAIGGAIVLTTAYVQGMQIENEQVKLQGSREAWQKMAAEYERAGERGVVQAMQDMKQAEQKARSGLFWK